MKKLRIVELYCPLTCSLREIEETAQVCQQGRVLCFSRMKWPVGEVLLSRKSISSSSTENNCDTLFLTRR